MLHFPKKTKRSSFYGQGRWKNNSNVAKKALEKTPVEIKDIIVKSINQFCDLTQQKGVKGDLFIKKVSCNNKTPQGIEYSFLEYSIKIIKELEKNPQILPEILDELEITELEFLVLSAISSITFCFWSNIFWFANS